MALIQSNGVFSVKIITILTLAKFCFGATTTESADSSSDDADYFDTKINPDELLDETVKSTKRIQFQNYFLGNQTTSLPIILTQSEMLEFRNWRLKFNRTDLSSDDHKAAKNYVENDARIQKFNQKNASYRQGHNKYSDQSYQQHKNFRTGLKLSERSKNKIMDIKSLRRLSIPNYVNHRRQMGPVKDQRDCGACYAFAATAVVEFIYRSRKINPKKYILSEQDIIDCDVLSFGCQGGWPTKVLKYIQDRGVANGIKYKYAESQQICLRSQYPAIANLSGYHVCEKYLKGNETMLKSLVVDRPVIVGFVSIR